MFSKKILELLTIYIPVGMAIFSEKEEEETTKVDEASTPEVKLSITGQTPPPMMTLFLVIHKL